MSSPVVRKEILILVDEAKSSGATMKGISSTVGYSTRTLNRWRSSQVDQRHQGKDRDILQARKILYEESKSKNPLRWSGSTRRWVFIKKVYLNPNKERVNTTEDILTSKLHSS